MATYAIGDIQGCHRELLDLLKRISFDQEHDRLWFTGDLVNRGPDSLEVLRFVRSLDDAAITVLGNHDLHLLAVAAGRNRVRDKDTLAGVLNAPDRDALLAWLAGLPLFHRDPALGFAMVHAGLAPQWRIKDAARLAREVERALCGDTPEMLYENMYGDEPDSWSEQLTGWPRLRFITNCLTRLRFCDRSGRLAMEEKSAPGQSADTYLPWYAVPERRSADQAIIFGHWSTIRLGGITDFSGWNVFPLDTGCVWGGELTALRLDDRKFFSVPSRQKRAFD